MTLCHHLRCLRIHTQRADAQLIQKNNWLQVFVLLTVWQRISFHKTTQQAVYISENTLFMVWQQCNDKKLSFYRTFSLPNGQMSNNIFMCEITFTSSLSNNSFRKCMSDCGGKMGSNKWSLQLFLCLWHKPQLCMCLISGGFLFFFSFFFFCWLTFKIMKRDSL